MAPGAAEYLAEIREELSGGAPSTCGEKTRNLAMGAFKKLQS
jgi:hypothetical protein